MIKQNEQLLRLLEEAHELASENQNGAHNEDTRNIAVAIGVVKMRLKYLGSQGKAKADEARAKAEVKAAESGAGAPSTQTNSGASS